jgi:hypothetical protein
MNEIAMYLGYSILGIVALVVLLLLGVLLGGLIVRLIYKIFGL